MRAHGIDISKWDRSFDPALARAPIDFVIQRAGYGVVRDELFDELHAGVLRVPIRGAYHYFMSAVGWKKQADAFLKWVDGKGFHFYVCDFEAAYNQMTLGFVASAMEWIKYIHDQTGTPVVLYSNPATYDGYLRYDARAKNYPLWIAQYYIAKPDPQTANPKMPKHRDDWILWQYAPGDYGHDGLLYGVGRNGVDVNVYNGTVDDMRAWLGLIAEPDQPPPVTPPVDPPVVIPGDPEMELIKTVKSLIAAGVPVSNVSVSIYLDGDVTATAAPIPQPEPGPTPQPDPPVDSPVDPQANFRVQLLASTAAGQTHVYKDPDPNTAEAALVWAKDNVVSVRLAPPPDLYNDPARDANAMKTHYWMPAQLIKNANLDWENFPHRDSKGGDITRWRGGFVKKEYCRRMDG